MLHILPAHSLTVAMMGAAWPEEQKLLGVSAPAAAMKQPQTNLKGPFEEPFKGPFEEPFKEPQSL